MPRVCLLSCLLLFSWVPVVSGPVFSWVVLVSRLLLLSREPLGSWVPFCLGCCFAANVTGAAGVSVATRVLYSSLGESVMGADSIIGVALSQVPMVSQVAQLPWVCSSCHECHGCHWALGCHSCLACYCCLCVMGAAGVSGATLSLVAALATSVTGEALASTKRYLRCHS